MDSIPKCVELMFDLQLCAKNIGKIAQVKKML